MKLGGNLPPGHDALLFPISGVGSYINLGGVTHCEAHYTRGDFRQVPMKAVNLRTVRECWNCLSPDSVNKILKPMVLGQVVWQENSHEM